MMIDRLGRPRWFAEWERLAETAADLAAHAVRWSSPASARHNVDVTAAIAADWRRIADRAPDRPPMRFTWEQQRATLVEAFVRAERRRERNPGDLATERYVELIETLLWWIDQPLAGGASAHTVLDVNLAFAAQRAAAEQREAA